MLRCPLTQSGPCRNDWSPYDDQISSHLCRPSSKSSSKSSHRFGSLLRSGDTANTPAGIWNPAPPRGIEPIGGQQLGRTSSRCLTHAHGAPAQAPLTVWRRVGSSSRLKAGLSSDLTSGLKSGVASGPDSEHGSGIKIGLGQAPGQPSTPTCFRLAPLCAQFLLAWSGGDQRRFVPGDCRRAVAHPTQFFRPARAGT